MICPKCKFSNDASKAKFCPKCGFEYATFKRIMIDKFQDNIQKLNLNK